MFDDIPLVKYEREVFSECGAWKNFWDLEDSLTLEELLVLYDAAMTRSYRVAKVVAMAMGADVDLSENDGDLSAPPEDKRSHVPPSAIDPDVGGETTPIFGAEQIRRLPISLGYSTIAKE